MNKKQFDQGVQPTIDGVDVRYSRLEDGRYMEPWFKEPGVLRGFPLKTDLEIQDAIRYWIGFSRYYSSLTATINGVPCGVGSLILTPYVKIAHHCLISIIVGEKYRNKGIGTYIINNLIHLAKTNFKLDVLYLEVYEGNPAINLYKRFGFKEVGFQKHFLKDEGSYIGKIIMEKLLFTDSLDSEKK